MNQRTEPSPVPWAGTLPSSEEALDADLWRAIAPRLSIGGSAPAPRSGPNGERRTLALDRVLREGYDEFPDVLEPRVCEPLVAAVGQLRTLGLPAVFALVYDETWELAARMAPFLEAILGGEYRQLPDMWVWYVEPDGKDRGWHPHRDKGVETVSSKGEPATISAWGALSDATPLNGCIYLVPMDLDPMFQGVSQIPIRNQDIRALPAAAGTAFLWNQGILHWGSRSSARATRPRVSVAMEFQRGDQEPYNRPLLDPKTPPPFELRVALIGKQIRQYKHMVAPSDELAQLAEHLSRPLEE